MRKRILSILLCGFLFAMPVSASVCELNIGDRSLRTFEDGAIGEIPLDAPAFLSPEGRTMVPIRAIATALGAEVGWVDETKTVTLTKGDTTLSLTIGANMAFRNGEAMQLDSPPCIVEKRTMVPLRFISEAFLAEVSYLDATKCVLIDASGVIMRTASSCLTKAQLDTLCGLLHHQNQADAAAYGIDKETFTKLCVEAAYEHGMELLKMEAAFPEITADAETMQKISEEAAALSSGPYMPLPGMRALLHLRMYQTGSQMVYAHFMEKKADFLDTYLQNYICAKHVLCQDEETAKLVYEKAIGGESFDALISAYNIDPGMSANPDGYVFTRGEMVLPFEEAAFSAREGEITPPVKTDYGYHVLQRLPLPKMSDDTLIQLAYPVILARYQAAETPQCFKTVEELLPLYQTAE